MRVAVVGQGYVGLTVAVCLAEAGHQVTGVERSPERLEPLRRREAPFYEPGLQPLLTEIASSGRLGFTKSLDSATPPPEAVIVAVGSPQLPSGGTDLRDLAIAMRDILALNPLPKIVVVKSTVPPGTSRQLMAQTGLALSARYVYSPEFLSHGSALTGWRRPSRIVVGLEEEGLLPLVAELYRGIRGPWVTTTPTNAEMIKYASNAFLATKISFINEIANLCDEVGATIDDVVEGLSHDPRVGRHFLRAGIGYGGSCFPKDVQALTHLSSLKGRAMPLLQSVVAVNSAQRLRVVRALQEHLDPRTGATVAVLGLSFKPDTDDTREAPSRTVIPELISAGYQIRVWDPVIPDAVVARDFPGVEPSTSVEEAAVGAGAVVVFTEWPQVAGADWETIAESVRPPGLVVDARNCLDPSHITALGLAYMGIGRGLRMPAVGAFPLKAGKEGQR